MQMGLGIGLWSSSPAVQVTAASAAVTWDTVSSNATYTYDAPKLAATRATGTGDAIVRCATGHTSGSFDITVTMGTSDCLIGFTSNPTGSVSTWAGDTNNMALQSGGNLYANGAGAGTTGVTYTTGDKIRAAYNGSTVTFSKWNGSSWTALSPTVTFGGGAALYPICSTGGTGTVFTADFTNWP